MHYKRRGSKHVKGRSTFNKPWKFAGVKTDSVQSEKFSDHRRRQTAANKISDENQYLDIKD